MSWSGLDPSVATQHIRQGREDRGSDGCRGATGWMRGEKQKRERATEVRPEPHQIDEGSLRFRTNSLRKPLVLSQPQTACEPGEEVWSLGLNITSSSPTGAIIQKQKHQNQTKQTKKTPPGFPVVGRRDGEEAGTERDRLHERVCGAHMHECVCVHACPHMQAHVGRSGSFEGWAWSQSECKVREAVKGGTMYRAFGVRRK